MKQKIPTGVAIVIVLIIAVAATTLVLIRIRSFNQLESQSYNLNSFRPGNKEISPVSPLISSRTSPQSSLPSSSAPSVNSPSNSTSSISSRTSPQSSLPSGSAPAASTSSESSPPQVGGGPDSHGCVSDGGYQWCKEKQKCVRIWEESCPSLNK